VEDNAAGAVSVHDRMPEWMADSGAPLAARPSSLTPQQWGILAFLLSEVAFFGTLITVYLHFLGMDNTGPTPQILALPLVIFNTICLLSSSFTVHRADKTLQSGARGWFVCWWSATIILGIVFLSGTGFEWRDLIQEHDLTISTNLFGSTYYTLVGFHALHVTIGVIIMLTVLGLAVRRRLTAESRPGVELISWYWHFVDAVWVVVFTVVYVLGR
jgi:cytochrome c oxidase subunit 3/cytochrome o ubiquinol oxidase subunit 3